MATLSSYFRDFLQSIRPTANQRKEMQTGHSTLRTRLTSYEPLKGVHVSDFLQGSYRRSTALRPVGDSRSDVDIVVVTNLKQEEYKNPQDAMEVFRPFVKEYYNGKYSFQGRSIGIELSYVKLDLVITSAPSEADQNALRLAAVQSWDTPEDVSDWRLNEYWVPSIERNRHGVMSLLTKASSTPQWKLEPLWIPDREAGKWEETHPLAQIDWTFAKNKSTDRHFVNVVKAIKWWRRAKHPTSKHPKGYPLEHIIGECCPNGISSIAEGVARTLEEIRDRYSRNVTPYLPDRGVNQNVMRRISNGEFARFHDQVTDAAKLARDAYDEDDTAESAKLWRELFGDKFPKPPDTGSGGETTGRTKAGGYSERRALGVPPRGRFA